MLPRIPSTLILSFLFLLFLIPESYSQCNDTEVTVTSTTGNWGYEMSWELQDSTGQIIEIFQGVNDNEVSVMVICIPDGCYTINALDSYGDGWNGGSVVFEWASNTETFEMTESNQSYFYFGINMPDCVPVTPGCTDPTALNYDPNATVDNGSCQTLTDVVAAQVFDTICYSGSKDNRINWVIQNRSATNSNNNFTDADDLRAGLEESLIPAFTYGDIGAKVPYAQYKNFFNLYAAWWPDAPSDDTWWHFSVIQSMRDEIFLPWANDETGWVTWFSTTKYGGGGGAGLNRDARVGDGKMYGTGYSTLLHEFGHTMPGLLDEYTSSGEWSNNQCWETGNTTGYTIKDSIPWRNWIEDDTPLPTPYDGNYENVVAAFEGGLTNYFGCHRPTAKGCYMGAGGFGEGYGEDLCSPCVQRVICFLYLYVNVIENPSPANPDLSVTGAQSISFSADVVAPEPNTQKYEWFLNGKLVAEGVTSVDLTFGDCAEYELKFAVTDTTELVRYDEKFDHIYPRPYREFVWNIDQEDVNSYDLASAATSTDTDCTGNNNGEVQLTISGGLAPYEVWLEGNTVNNPALGLAPGNHLFTVVDANGCSVNENIQINQDDLLDLEICADNDGGWEVSVSSENYDPASLDLLWSTGATTPTVTGLTDGNYSLTATVNGCTVSESFELITAPESLTVTENYFPSEIGNATGTIYVDVSGGSETYHIEWYERLMADRTDDNTDNILASGTTWGHLPEMAFDDDLGTKWLHAVPNNAWITYQFPSPTTIAYYVITSADDVPARDPEDWVFEGSMDGNTWTTLDSRNNEDFPERFQARTFPIANTGAYTYYRLYVLSSAGENQIQLQELEFIGTDPGAPFLYNPEFDDHFSRSQLAPGEYQYEVSDASSACADALINIDAYEIFTVDDLVVVQDGSCAVSIENPTPGSEYYWLSDEEGSQLLGTGISFEPPHAGNFYVAAAPNGSDQWSNNHKGFAVTMPEPPTIEEVDLVLYIVDPLPDETYLWYSTDDCGTPIHEGTSYTPGIGAEQFYISAQSTITYPDPIDPAGVQGLILRMDAADLDGDGMIDNPAPPTSSVLDWYFPTGNNWDTNNWFAYRSNYQNGLGIADWATLWLQRIENGQSNFQTVLMAYQENDLSWAESGPMEALSETMPRHSDASQLYADSAPDATLNGSTFLNGQEVDPLTTSNPMEFCILGSSFTSPSNANILYTDVHWEGKIGEMLFYDTALSDEEMMGVSEFLRQKWISTAELESPRTPYEWAGIVSTEEPLAEVEVSLSPNPTQDFLFIESNSTLPLQVRVFNSQGRLVQDGGVLMERKNMDVSQLVAGVYQVSLMEEGKVAKVLRFVKI